MRILRLILVPRYIYVLSQAAFLGCRGAGVFVADGLEWVGVRQIRNATTTEQIREGMRISGSTSRLGMASMLTILVFGFYGGDGLGLDRVDHREVGSDRHTDRAFHRAHRPANGSYWTVSGH